MQLHFDAVNKSGGIHGHTFALLRKDDRGRPEETIQLTKQLLAEEKPLLLAGYFGSKNVADLVASGLLEKERIALIGYRTSEIRAEAPNLYNVRAGLREEINKLTEHLSTVGIVRLGLFYEAGPGTEAVIAAADDAAKSYKCSIVVRSSYAANTTSVATAVDAFLKQPPQAIIMVSNGAATASFIEAYRRAGGTAQILAHSGADIEQLSKRLSEEQMQGVAIAQVTPSPYKIANRLAKEFADAVAKAPKLEVPVSYAMIEGYIVARVIVEAVRRQGRNPTREGVKQALDSMGNFDLGGYQIGYRPGQRSGSRYVELSIVTSTGKIRQ